jgi:hypothetical protein
MEHIFKLLMAITNRLLDLQATHELWTACIMSRTEIGWSRDLYETFFRARVINHSDFFRTVLMYGIKRTFILDSKKSGNSTTCGIFTVTDFNFI